MPLTSATPVAFSSPVAASLVAAAGAAFSFNVVVVPDVLPVASGYVADVVPEFAPVSVPSAWPENWVCFAWDDAPDVVPSSAANAALGTIMGHIATLIKTEMTLFALLVFISLSSSFPFSLDSNSCYISIPAVTAFGGKRFARWERLCGRLRSIRTTPMQNAPIWRIMFSLQDGAARPLR